MAPVTLKEVDRVEILSIMDNSIDVLMGNTPIAKRHKRKSDGHKGPQLRAEHGVSMLVTTYSGGNKDSFLFDTGVTVDGVLHNMDVLDIKGNELHAVVLSHGHTDHTRGLMYLPEAPAWGYAVFLVHVAVAMELVLLAPFMKLAHAVYRPVAMFFLALATSPASPAEEVSR